MRNSLKEVYEAIKNTLEHWEVKSSLYSLQLKQDQLELWSFDDDSKAGLSPCRFLITPTDESLIDPNMSTKEFYIDFATADESYTYKFAFSSPDRLVKILIVLREGQRNFRGLIHHSDKGFPQDELAKLRCQIRSSAT